MQRTIVATATASFLAILAYLARPLLWGEVYWYDDLVEFHLPLRQFYANCLQSGFRFDWMPELFCGWFVSAEGQLGAYHPVHVLLYSYLNLETAFNFEMLLNFPLAAFGMGLFLRRRLSAAAASFGALAFALCSFNMMHGHHINMVAVAAHIPWLLWLIDIVFTSRRGAARLSSGAGIALLTGSQLLLGYPQILWFSLLAEGCYALLLLTQVDDRRLLGSGVVVVALVLGLGVGAVQLIPTFSVYAESTRAVTGFSPNQGSMHPVLLVQLLAPYAPWNGFSRPNAGWQVHEYSPYLGAIPTLLAIWWLTRPNETNSPQDRFIRRLSIAACILAGFCLILSLGGYGLIYRLQTLLPIVGRFRCPSRYLLLVQLCVVVMAAIGFERLLRNWQPAEPEKTDSSPAVRSVWYVALLATLVAGGFHMFSRNSSGWHLWLPPLFFVAGAICVTLGVRGNRLAVLMLVPLTAADLGIHSLTYRTWQRTAAVAELRENAKLPVEPSARVASPRNSVTLAGYRRVEGYAGLAPPRALDYSQEQALRAGAAQGVWDPESGWTPVTDSLGRCHLYCQTLLSADPAVDINRIDLANTVLTSRPIDLNADAVSGQAIVIEDSPGRIRIRTQTSEQQLLLITERYDSRWRVTVNSVVRQVERLNGEFLGCEVPGGESEILFEFAPRSVTIGAWCSVLTSIFCLLAAAIGLFTYARSQAGPAD